MTPEVVSIGRGNTLVIPENMMKELGIKEGHEVIIYVEDGKIIIEPMPKDAYKVLKEVIGEPYEESRDHHKTRVSYPRISININPIKPPS